MKTLKVCKAAYLSILLLTFLGWVAQGLGLISYTVSCYCAFFLSIGTIGLGTAVVYLRSGDALPKQEEEEEEEEKVPKQEEERNWVRTCDIRALRKGGYGIIDNKVAVRGYDNQDGERLFFLCPFCFSRYKKNGLPYANAKHEVHLVKYCWDMIENVTMSSKSVAPPCPESRWPEGVKREFLVFYVPE